MAEGSARFVHSLQPRAMVVPTTDWVSMSMQCCRRRTEAQVDLCDRAVVAVSVIMSFYVCMYSVHPPLLPCVAPPARSPSLSPNPAYLTQDQPAHHRFSGSWTTRRETRPKNRRFEIRNNSRNCPASTFLRHFLVLVLPGPIGSLSRVSMLLIGGTTDVSEH